MLDNILSTFYGSYWAILPERLEEIERYLQARVADGRLHEIKAAAASDKIPYAKAGSVAVVPIHGTIYPRGGPNAMSGATTAEWIGRAVDQAAADSSVSSIVLDVNSPGGVVQGTAEAAEKIRNAAAVKRVDAVVNHMAASGGYWLASQASNIAVAPNGMVGSIGVMWVHEDPTVAMEKRGIRVTALKTSPYKNEGMLGPLTEAAIADRMEKMQEFHRQFVGAVASGRGATAEQVDAKYGQGRMLLPSQALAAGMIDRVATLEDVIAEARARSSNREKFGLRARAAALTA